MSVEGGFRRGQFFCRDVRRGFWGVPWPRHRYGLFALGQDCVLHGHVQGAGKHGVHGHGVLPVVDGGVQVGALFVQEPGDEADGPAPPYGGADAVSVEVEPDLKVVSNGCFVLLYEAEEPSNSPMDAPNRSPTASIHFIVNTMASAPSRSPLIAWFTSAGMISSMM